jgi:hypothetical protein
MLQFEADTCISAGCSINMLLKRKVIRCNLRHGVVQYFTCNLQDMLSQT